MRHFSTILLILSLFFLSFSPVFAHEDDEHPVEISPTITLQKVTQINNQIWLFVGVAAGGIIVGSLGTFILMTMTLHPKK